MRYVGRMNPTRRALHAALLALALVGCSRPAETAATEEQPAEGSIQAAIAEDEAKFASYPGELAALIDGRRDGEAEVGSENLAELPGWKHQYWTSTAISDSADLWFNPSNRSEFFLTLNGFHGDPEFPGAATYLVENEVETQSDALQAVYWCVTGGPYTGSALSTSFSETDQTVFLKSPGFLALRPDYPCG